MPPTIPHFAARNEKATRLDDRPLADLNFVLGLIREDDRLHDRTRAYLSSHESPPIVPFTVGVELLLWCVDTRADPVHAMTACVESLDVERPEVLTAAARLMRDERMESPFDALNVVQAEQRGVPLVTDDGDLRRRGFPVETF